MHLKLLRIYPQGWQLLAKMSEEMLEGTSVATNEGGVAAVSTTTVASIEKMTGIVVSYTRQLQAVNEAVER